MKKYSLLVFFLISFPAVQAFAPVNFLSPYDPLWQPYHTHVCGFDFSLGIESGSKGSSSDIKGNRQTLLGVYNPTQSIIPMLENPQGSVASAGASAILMGFMTAGGPFTDDGTRGNVRMFATFKETNINLTGGYTFNISGLPGYFTINLYLPIKDMRVSDFMFQDLTQSNFMSELAMQAFIRDLANQAQQLGGLSLDNWHESGLGDVVLLLEWSKKIMPSYGKLKVITPYLRFGVSMPTGESVDINKMLSMPLGNGGQVGLPLAAGFDFEFAGHLRAGVYAEVMYFFDHTHERRLKTAITQTEPLLLNVGNATKNFGSTWIFEAYAEAFKIWRGFSVKLAWQYVHHDDDKLFTKDPAFSNDIINTANSLKDWTMHNLMLQGTYDFSKEFDQTWLTPYIGIFYKFGVGGQGIIDNNTVGGMLGVGF
ncbi:hypothetical protein K2W90_06260 [Candidatus Babeliales bacterium]|nr:hypothetical protein [Candidatus Babeliales bacterium]